MVLAKVTVDENVITRSKPKKPRRPALTTSKSIEIGAYPEPIDLTGQGHGVVVIRWEIDNASRWYFVTPAYGNPGAKGIEIKNPGTAFSPGGGGRKFWIWIRNEKQADRNSYGYTIWVTDGITTASWDPSIINQP